MSVRTRCDDPEVQALADQISRFLLYLARWIRRRYGLAE